ncbi:MULTISPECIES: hypothetical protein [Streptomyces]|uniref:hypothetical protein n=1 Tax=Streptomyces TaxID=1883 RepID=UPI002E280C5D|nr:MULTISPECIES: hypothetical protein [Streptomyces]
MHPLTPPPPRPLRTLTRRITTQLEPRPQHRIHSQSRHQITADIHQQLQPAAPSPSRTTSRCTDTVAAASTSHARRSLLGK